jgi:hypothetical protein
MKMIFINVLYRKGRDLLLFEFNFQDDPKNPVQEITDLINFHFFERHDFDECIERQVSSIFKNFYDEDYKDEDGDDVQFIDWEEKEN